VDWQLVGVISETVNAVAVVVSLVYLAIQIRHTRQQAAPDNLQATVDLWVKAQGSLMRSEQDADFLRHALHNYGEPSPAQIARFHTFMADLVVPFQAILAKHESGLIDPRFWQTLRADMAGWFKCPGMLSLWKEVRFVYPPYIVAQIDDAIEAHVGVPFTETLPHLKLADGARAGPTRAQ